STVFFYPVVVSTHYSPANLRLGVRQHRISFYHMLDQRIAQHHHFYRHPLVAMIGGRTGADAMIGKQFTLHFHMGARRAQISRRALSRTRTPQQLYFDRDGKVLVFSHTFGRLGMHHDTTVAESPPFSSGGLLAGKPV